MTKIPNIDIPTFKETLPASKKEVIFRPFLVRERSVLLMALQSADISSVIKAIKDLIKTCTFGKIDAEKIPLVDLEFLFINIRNKSIGEGIDIIHTCDCGTGNELQVMMDKIDVIGGTDDNIQLSDQVWIKLNYPTIDDVSLLSAEPNEKEVLQIIANCIDTIIAGEQVYKAVDSTKEELYEFILNLTQSQLSKIETFFENIPKIVVKFDYKCKSCGKDNHETLQGLENFFD